MSKTSKLKLPHFFLFNDLQYSFLEAKKILKNESNPTPAEIKQLAKHYLILFEILEFLHEYTPDFFVINKINNTQNEIVCFANQDFSKTFHLKKTPEGKDILNFFPLNPKKQLQLFIESEIKKAGNKLKKQDLPLVSINSSSQNFEFPIKSHDNRYLRLFEVHIKLVGETTIQNKSIDFNGYSILIGRDTTKDATIKKLASAFTNIPKNFYKHFFHEAYRRKIMQKPSKSITMKNVYVLTGSSDITSSSELRLEAIKRDKEDHSYKNSASLNKLIDKINSFLHSEWADLKGDLEIIHPGIYLFEETDGVDYTICFSEGKDLGIITKEKFLMLKEVELEIMIKITKACMKKGFPVKQLIISYDKQVDFYFEERFENKFKIETKYVDLYIKKKRLEKGHDIHTGERIFSEHAVTITTDNIDDLSFYKSLISKYKKKKIITNVETGEVEKLPGLLKTYYIKTFV